MLVIFNNLTKGEKTKAVQNLIEDTNPRQEFYFIIILSVLLSGIGLILDDIAVIIGSMLIAPLIFPALALGLGATLGNWRLVSRSLLTLIIASLLGFVAAYLLGLLVGTNVTFELQSYIKRIQPSYLFTVAALIAGIAASFAVTKEYLNNALPGVAMAVALIPPLAAAGIGAATEEYWILAKAGTQYLINIVAITAGAFAVFRLMHFEQKKNDINRKIKQEQEKKEREEKRVAK